MGVYYCQWGKENSALLSVPLPQKPKHKKFYSDCNKTPCSCII